MGTAALGWDWVAAPTFANLLTLAGTLIAAITVVASIVSARAARRGLYVTTVAVDRTWDLQPAAGRRSPGPGPDPHRMVIRFTYRGASAIETAHFDGKKDLVFDVGAGITRLEECRTDPGDAPKPRFRCQGSSLFFPPAMINPGTSVYASLVIEDAPARPVTCTRAVLANVRVQSVEDADTKARAYLASLAGAAAIVAALLLPRAAPSLSATLIYRVFVTLACAIAFAIILAARIRRPRSAAALSVAVLLGLVASIGWLDARPDRAGHHVLVPARPAPAAYAAPRCPAVGDGHWSTVYHVPGEREDNETVGYSTSDRQFFGNPGFPGEDPAQRAQDRRVRFDEQQIFTGNNQANCDYWHDNRAGDIRPLVELVYFAGLTEGADEDYDSGEAEELEGLLAAQQQENRPSAGRRPLLKIIIANGGSKMQDARPVARHIVSLAGQDPYLLGVVGMDRSITQVQYAIQLFAHHRIPVVATTLSADRIGQNASPYYYQLSPPNSSEAALISQYVSKVVPAYFRQSAEQYPSGGQITARRIVIEEPDRNPDDLYTATMVDDLMGQPWHSSGLPQPQVIYQPGTALCGDSTVDIYAGRHDQPAGSGRSYNNDFSSFLSYIENSCPGSQPFIVADDGVTRFVADPAQRTTYTDAAGQPLWISYVTKGIAMLRTGTACLHRQAAARYGDGPFGTFCQAYAGIAGTLRAKLPGLDLLWTGERVGLAYDAANLFLTAASRDGQPTRAQIPHEFGEDGPVVGVTGTVNFAASSIGADSRQGMPLAVVRLDLGNTYSTPTCEFPGQHGALYGPGPGNGTCPNSQG